MVVRAEAAAELAVAARRLWCILELFVYISMKKTISPAAIQQSDLDCAYTKCAKDGSQDSADR